MDKGKLKIKVIAAYDLVLEIIIVDGEKIPLNELRVVTGPECLYQGEL